MVNKLSQLIRIEAQEPGCHRACEHCLWSLPVRGEFPVSPTCNVQQFDISLQKFIIVLREIGSVQGDQERVFE